MRPIRSLLKWWRVALLLGLLLTGAFTYYLFTLYRQLELAFDQQNQFIPTRIYSDVTRITPPQTREQIETRLATLAYSFNRAGDADTLTLHPVDYPTYLIPEGHPTLDARTKAITLNFDGAQKSSMLSSIHLGSEEIPDLYLEPELIATLARGGVDVKKEIRAYLSFSQIPATVWKAIIAVEDQHFQDHSGFDPRGLARAIFVNLKTLSFAQGGSTLTQQLVKNLMARHTKNVFRKVNELFLALLLEVKMDKEKILERYLNEVYLGQVGSLEVHGVEEGAEYFFGKKIDDLNLAEISLMAGLIRGPGYYSPYRYRERAIERQHLVLKKMVETGQIAQGEADAALRMPIRLAPPQNSSSKAPFFTDFVKAELIRTLKDKINEQDILNAGFRIYTTLNTAENAEAQKAVAQGITDLEKRLGLPPQIRLEGALAAVDQSTGYVRALIGGRSYAQSNFNRILNMKRQVGSTFKPLVYLTAYEKGEDPTGVPYGPGHPAEDAPWKLIYDHGHQNWTPKNYEKEHLGWINYRLALAHSINTVAAKLGTEVGNAAVIKTARALGIQSDLPDVPSLCLGVAELSPIELLRAYASIANHGIQDELTVIRGITHDNGSNYARFIYHPQQVYSSGPADLITDTMQNVFTEGTAREAGKMGFDRVAAGKTGTTSHHRDAWFAGFTPQLTSVVWVGMDQDREIHGTDAKKAKALREKVKLTGANSALPIWVRFMKNALSGEAPAVFPISSQLTASRIDRHTGKLATNNCPDTQTLVDKYVIGHEPKTTTCESLWPATQNETIAR